MRLLSLALLALALLAAPSSADAKLCGKKGWISEFRLGAQTHDSDIPDIFTNRQEQGMDISGELFFNSPGIFHYIWSPRISVGGQYSLANDTHHAHVSLNWRADFWDNLFAEFGAGLAVHDGQTNVGQKTPAGLITPESDAYFQGTKRLGSRILFRLAPEIGWQITEHHSISLIWVHLSNGKMFGDGGAMRANQGLDSFGLRYGYRF